MTRPHHAGGGSPAPAPEPRSWLGVHVFYDGDLDAVAGDLLGDITARLAAEEAAEGLFFLRHWEAGPHVRIRVLPGPRRTGDARRIVTGAAEAFLARRPAPSLVGQAEYERYAPAFAAAEEAAGYERRRRPNNSLAEIPYRPETGKYGTGAALHAVEDHFVRCSAVVREVISADPQGGRRAATAFALLALAWWTAPSSGDAPSAPVSPPRGVPEPAAAPADLYHRRRDALLDTLARTRDLAAAARGRPAGTLGMWAWSVAAAVDGLRDPARARRVLDQCAHLACNRLGLDASRELTLRRLLHLAAADHLSAGRSGGPASAT
ncbi:lantibiotic dehydratase C-terminal domain-containing protein [Nocardiopsis sp. NPDC057823]|uniref:lantibiotic dehydratase C-terminal domain-containing protein n=1 Tax=Nocardiopsis sp. NPDC057823 TaxID=3346256 RepID=UPI00366D8B92